MTRAARRAALLDLHPELRRAARFLPQNPAGPVSTGVIRRLQAMTERRARPADETALLASGGSVRVFRPERVTGPVPALVWIHGGGYVIGSATQDDAECRAFARRLGAIVVSVDYRLAPDHPFPAPVDDCYEALLWTTRARDVDPALIAIGGASAGGGLAAMTALRARDRGEVALVAQLLVYPMIDDRSIGAERADPAHRLWSTRSNAFGWRALLGRIDPDLVAPARRKDLAGLPPTWIGVGSKDLFHDEDVAYARRLEEAGVAVTLDVVPGAFHGFDRVVPKAAVVRRFADAQIAMLRAAYGMRAE